MYEHVKNGCKHILPNEQPLQFQSGYFLNKPRIYIKQTMFLGYTVLQLFYIYNFCYTYCNFAGKYVSYFYINTFHSMCAVPTMAVLGTPLISCFLSTFLRYCLNDSEMVPVAPIITGITFALTFHMRWTSVMRYLYFNIFSVSFLITFLSQGIAVSVNVHVPCLLAWIIMSSLSLGYYYYYYYYYYYHHHHHYYCYCYGGDVSACSGGRIGCCSKFIPTHDMQVCFTWMLSSIIYSNSRF